MPVRSRIPLRWQSISVIFAISSGVKESSSPPSKVFTNSLKLSSGKFASLISILEVPDWVSWGALGAVCGVGAGAISTSGASSAGAAAPSWAVAQAPAGSAAVNRAASAAADSRVQSCLLIASPPEWRGRPVDIHGTGGHAPLSEWFVGRILYKSVFNLLYTAALWYGSAVHAENVHFTKWQQDGALCWTVFLVMMRGNQSQ